MPASRTPRSHSLSKVPGVGGVAALGVGLAVAGATAALGFAADRLSRDRRLAEALDDGEGGAGELYRDEPDDLPVVVSGDGVPIYVEVDEPSADAPPPPDGAVRPTVVFCHGYCLSLRSWVFQRRVLRAAGYRVVLWDQRGHGQSGTGEQANNNIDRVGDDLSRVIEAAVPEGPIVLVGHSMGGMTIMSLALHRPEVIHERVVGVAFVATSPGRMGEVSFGFINPIGKVIHRLAPLTTTALAGRQRLVDGTVKIGRDVVDLLVDWGSFGSPVPLSIAQLTTDMIFGTRMDIISSFMPHFSTHDKREALAQFQGIETLVINGTADILTPPDHSEDIVREIPGAEHVIVADAGHIIMLEHPTVVSEQLLALVRRAERSSPGASSAPAGVRSTTRRVTDMAARRRASEAKKAIASRPLVARTPSKARTRTQTKRRTASGE